MRTIKVRLNSQSIGKAIAELEDYQRRIDNAGAEIVRRLSLIGYDVAYRVMGGHVYTGETIGSLTIEEISPTKMVLTASSTAILFFEFGAGVYGTGHPLAGEFGMGAGTYPNQTHALDPNGWWFPTDDANLTIYTDKDGQGWGHSFGNPPYMPMYQAAEQMKKDLETVAKEVLLER